MSRSNRRREDETKPVRRRHGDRGRHLRSEALPDRAPRGRAGGSRDDDDRVQLDDLVFPDDADDADDAGDDDPDETGGGDR